MGDDARAEPEVLEDLDDLALVDRASTLALDLETDDGDEDAYQRISRELLRRGTRVIFDEAARLILSEDPRLRILACDLLGQLGFKQNYPFAAESIPLLAEICTKETSPSLLDSAISAMGHLCRPEALSYVMAHANHSDPDVRHAVACALPSLVGVEWLGPEHPAVTR